MSATRPALTKQHKRANSPVSTRSVQFVFRRANIRGHTCCNSVTAQIRQWRKQNVQQACRTVKSIQQFRRFVPLVRRVPRERGRHATIRARGYERLPSLACCEQVFHPWQSIPRKTAVSFTGIRSERRRQCPRERGEKTRRRGGRTGKKAEFNRASAGVSGEIGDADRRRDLDPIKTRYLFLRSFKNVLKRKKANGHGAGRREGLKEAETPESR